ncbi:hypothetical protein BDW75DRAFT_229225 [Aspergillus navahoensis]
MARGYGYSRYSGLPSCSEYAFERQAPRIDIAFAAFYFIVTLVLLILASRRIGRSRRQGQPVAGAVWLMLSIIFALWTHNSSYIVDIVYISISECDIFSYSNTYQASVLMLWLSGISEYLLLAAILTSITRKLQNDFRLVQPFVLTAQAAWAVLVGLVLVAVLGVNTAWLHYYYNDSSFSSTIADLTEPQRGLRTTYYVIAAAGMLIASATLGKTLSQAPRGVRSRGVTISVIVLVVGALGLTLTNMGNYVQNAFMYIGQSFYYDSSEYKEYLARYEAASFLTSLFYCLALYAAIRVASQRVNAASVMSASAHPPPPPPPQPPMTFTTGNEGYHSGPAYHHSLGLGQGRDQGYGRNSEYVR